MAQCTIDLYPAIYSGEPFAIGRRSRVFIDCLRERRELAFKPLLDNGELFVIILYDWDDNIIALRNHELSRMKVGDRLVLYFYEGDDEGTALVHDGSARFVNMVWNSAPVDVAGQMARFLPDDLDTQVHDANDTNKRLSWERIRNMTAQTLVEREVYTIAPLIALDSYVRRHSRASAALSVRGERPGDEREMLISEVARIRRESRSLVDLGDLLESLTKLFGPTPGLPREPELVGLFESVSVGRFPLERR